ncbi:hypothetical protein J7J26_03190 [Candidatus Micrarchaeota archaeon]|nr:hypothetical protein [Candidatus Micrarchaeota archaeon]
MWRELVRMYSMIDTPEFQPIDLIIIKKRLSDIDKSIENTDSLNHLREIKNQYQNEILEMSKSFSHTTQIYRNNKLKNELKKYISEFHRIKDEDRERIVNRYRYLTSMNKPIFSENTTSKIFLEDFISRIEQRKLRLFLKDMEDGKRIMIDKKNVVIINNDNASVIPTAFILSTIDALGMTKYINISEVPIILDVKKKKDKLKVTIKERLIENNTIRSREKNIYFNIPKRYNK